MLKLENCEITNSYKLVINGLQIVSKGGLGNTGIIFIHENMCLYRYFKVICLNN